MIVTCILYGGLGNQLFQIFTTIAFSLKNKLIFTFQYTSNLGKRHTYWHTLLSSIIEHTSQNIDFADFIQINQGSTMFDNPPTNTNIVLNGYFQSFLFFEDEFKTIINMLQIDNNRQMYTKQHINCVSLHFRWGDYKSLQDCHPILDINYYINAVNYIRIVDPTITHIYYYCEDDDIEDIEKMVDKIRNEFTDDIIFERNREENDWEEMLSMSSCKHNIIANSSFSWWGAYLNNNPEKIVCYPSVWFGHLIQEDNTSMFPKMWIKI